MDVASEEVQKELKRIDSALKKLLKRAERRGAEREKARAAEEEEVRGGSASPVCNLRRAPVCTLRRAIHPAGLTWDPGAAEASAREGAGHTGGHGPALEGFGRCQRRVGGHFTSRPPCLPRLRRRSEEAGLTLRRRGHAWAGVVKAEEEGASGPFAIKRRVKKEAP